MLRSVLAFPVLAVLASLPSCRSDGDADAFISDRAGFSQESGGHVAALYIPNRLLDLVDVVHVGVGAGPGFGVELNLTRYGRLGAVAGVDAGIGWLGRFASAFQAAIYARATLGPMEAIGRPKRFADDKWGGLWRFPKWDVGLFLHAGLVMAFLSINPDEIVDFVAGIATYDTKADDF